MDEFNPYTPPRAESALEPFAPDECGVWRDGELLLMTKDASLPDRCLKCNFPADGYTLRRKLVWQRPNLGYILVPCSLMIYFLATYLLRQTTAARPLPLILCLTVTSLVRHLVSQTTTVGFPLCERHRKQRGRSMAIGWSLSLTGIGAMFAGFLNSEYMAIGVLGGVLLVIVGPIYWVASTELPTPRKIDQRFIWLKGVHPAFLDDLPLLTFLPQGDPAIAHEGLQQGPLVPSPK